MWGLALIGLMAMGISIWFVYMQGLSASPLPPALPAAIPRTDAVATREAYEANIETYQAANDLLRGEIGALRSDLERAQNELSQAQAQAQPPQRSEEWLVTLDRLPLALILDVPLFQQEHSLSCESSVAAMAAQYHGLAVSESDILGALPIHENPHLGFRGNVDGPYGGLVDYGVYAAPISQVLSGLGLQTEPFEGGIHEIQEQIRRGRPVLAWVTYGLQAQTPQQMMLADSNGQLQSVTLVPYEHAILIVGYNSDGLWVHDPYDGTRSFYSNSEFWQSFGYLGYMALSVGPPAS
jgi:uncharacterized protein YvpB